MEGLGGLRRNSRTRSRGAVNRHVTIDGKRSDQYIDWGVTVGGKETTTVAQRNVTEGIEGAAGICGSEVTGDRTTVGNERNRRKVIVGPNGVPNGKL